MSNVMFHVDSIASNPMPLEEWRSMRQAKPLLVQVAWSQNTLDMLGNGPYTKTDGSAARCVWLAATAKPQWSVKQGFERRAK